MDDLKNLPPELFPMIATFLSPSAIRVSKAFYQMGIALLWETLTPRCVWTDPESVRKLFRFREATERTPQALPLLRPRNQLGVLNFLLRLFFFEQKNLQNVMSMCCNLDTPDFACSANSFHFVSCACSCSHHRPPIFELLKKIKLRGYSLGNAGFGYLLYLWPNFDHLELDYDAGGLPGAETIELLSNNLRVVHFHFPQMYVRRGLEDRHVQNMPKITTRLPNLRNLKTLCLEYFFELPAAWQRHFTIAIKSCSHLRQLVHHWPPRRSRVGNYRHQSHSTRDKALHSMGV